MKIFKSSLAALAGAGMLIAQPAIAADAARSASNMSEAEGQVGGLSIGLVIGGIIAVLAILELTEVINLFGDDDPCSP